MASLPNSPSLRTLLIGGGALVVVLALLVMLFEGGDAKTEAAPEQTEIADRETPTQQRGATPRATTVALTQVSGEVRSTRGAGIADAVVTLVALDDEAEPHTTRSDAGGGWSIESLRPGRYALSATAADHLPAVQPLLELGEDGRSGVILQLEPGGVRLSGTVADKTGGVIEGALVRVTPQAGIARLRERDSYFTLSDEQGHYALQVPSGRAQVRASHADYTAESVVLEVRSGEVKQDFTLVPTAVIEGVVVRESDGAPVPGAEVSWARERALMLPDGGRVNTVERGGRVFADANGRFRISALPPGLALLSARASMLATGDPVQVPVGIAERIEGVELRVAEASDVEGRVVGAGQGIADAQVELMSQFGGGAWAQTDAEGYFRIHGVLPGSYRALATAEGWGRPSGPAPTIDVGTGGQPSSVVLELERGLAIRGRVEPAAAAEVAIELRPEAMHVGGGMIELGGAHATQSDAASGSFELAPVQPGHYTLEARAADGRGGTVEVDVGPDGASEVVIMLEQRAVLSGVVQDFNGKLLADVSVRARKRNTARSLSVVVNGQELTAASSPTSIEGRFEIAGLAAGAWQLEVVDAQGDPLAMDVGQQLELELGKAERRELLLRVEPRDGTISGIVRDAEGEPVADAWVSAAFVPKSIASPSEPESGDGEPRHEMRMVMITDDGSSTLRTLPPILTDERGRFAFTGLRRGEYTLTAELDGGASKATLEHVTPNAEVVLELAPLGAIEGSVLSNGGPANCVVTLTGPTPRTARVRDGKFEVQRLEPGSYTVEASAPDGSTSTTVEVEAGATMSVELALERLAKITGKILDESGAPIEGAEILVGAGEGGRIEISREDSDPVILTGPDGRFEVHAAAGGRVLLVQQQGVPMPIVIKPFVVNGGQDLDLGELRKQKLDGMMMMGGPEGELDAPE